MKKILTDYSLVPDLIKQGYKVKRMGDEYTGIYWEARPCLQPKVCKKWKICTCWSDEEYENV